MSSGSLGSERARDALDPAMHLVATVIEVAGVAIIVVGVLIASALFLRRGFGSSDWEKAYEGFRADLGRGILLGLEFLERRTSSERLLSRPLSRALACSRPSF